MNYQLNTRELPTELHVNYQLNTRELPSELATTTELLCDYTVFTV